jgi:hypothetical protein
VSPRRGQIRCFHVFLSLRAVGSPSVPRRWSVASGPNRGRRPCGKSSKGRGTSALGPKTLSPRSPGRRPSHRRSSPRPRRRSRWEAGSKSSGAVGYTYQIIQMPSVGSSAFRRALTSYPIPRLVMPARLLSLPLISQALAAEVARLGGSVPPETRGPARTAPTRSRSPGRPRDEVTADDVL